MTVWHGGRKREGKKGRWGDRETTFVSFVKSFVSFVVKIEI
jgi:hypothetical protein